MKMRYVSALALALGLTGAPVMAADDVMIVYDGSNSMWGQIDGIPKIEIAREVMGDLIATWPQSTNLGLVAYGHRRDGDCSDIEVKVMPGPVDRTTFRDAVNDVVPRGRTPLTAAVEKAAQLLSYRDNPATVILISDGVETCQADPCALSARLAEKGVAFTAHVIGFDLTRDEHEALACIAENTGGMFVPAENAEELRGALTQVRQVITPSLAEEASAAEPEVVRAVGLEAPAHVLVGKVFPVSWSEVRDRSDLVTVVPPSVPEDNRGPYLRVGRKTEGTLTAPPLPGMYEVRYLSPKNKEVLGRTSIEVVEAEMTVSAPRTAVTGSRIPVTWTTPINKRDIVAIVPAGAPDIERGNYARVGTKTEGVLTAPAAPGFYEIRYRLDGGGRVLASAPIEVRQAAVEVTGPDGAVRAGSRVTVGWSQSVNRRDRIAIVPADADPGDAGSTYRRVGSKTSMDLTVPDVPGLYEVRYVSAEGDRLLAAHPFEVVDAMAPLDAGAGLRVPATARPGEDIVVSWSISAADADRRVALAEVQAPDFSWLSAAAVGGESQMKLTMPDKPGPYEVRFLDLGGRKVLGRAIVEVTE